MVHGAEDPTWGVGVLIVVGAPMMGALAWSLRLVRRQALVTGAQNEVAQGHYLVASGLLERVEKGSSSRLVRRASETLRGRIALGRGELDEAVQRFDAALVAFPWWLKNR